jgi:hypothetical protein
LKSPFRAWAKKLRIEGGFVVTAAAKACVSDAHQNERLLFSGSKQPALELSVTPPPIVGAVHITVDAREKE